MKVVDPRKPPYRAPVGGVLDATREIQRAIDDLGVGAIYIGEPMRVTTLRPHTGVRFVGDGWDPDSSRRGSLLHGTDGHDVIVLPSSPGKQFSAIGFEGVGFVGGRNQIASSRLFTYLTLEHVLFSGPQEAAVAILRGSAEEWYFRGVYANGGRHFFRMRQVPNEAGSNYLDKSHFVDVFCGAQAENAWHVDCALSNNVSWDMCTMTFTGQHPFWARGGIRSWNFRGGNTEQCGTTGKNARTTGSIAAGDSRLDLADPRGFEAGDTVTVAAAGAPARLRGRHDLTARVRSVSGRTLVLDAQAQAAVEAAEVTNAIYDDFFFVANGGSAPGYILWEGGQWGMEGSRGRLRYAMNLSGVTSFSTIVGSHVAGNLAVYDPNRTLTVVGTPVTRRPLAAR